MPEHDQMFRNMRNIKNNIRHNDLGVTTNANNVLL